MGGIIKFLQLSTFSWEICTWNVPGAGCGLCPVQDRELWGVCPSGEVGGSHGFQNWEQKLHLGFSMPIPDSVLAAHAQSSHSQVLDQQEEEKLCPGVLEQCRVLAAGAELLCEV